MNEEIEKGDLVVAVQHSTAGAEIGKVYEVLDIQDECFGRCFVIPGAELPIFEERFRKITTDNQLGIGVGSKVVILDREYASEPMSSGLKYGEVYTVNEVSRNYFGELEDDLIILDNGRGVFRKRLGLVPEIPPPDSSEPKQTNDLVEKPNHYDLREYDETIQLIEAACADLPGEVAYSLGNLIKYVTRAHRKGTQIQDLRKACKCARMLEEKLEDL